MPARPKRPLSAYNLFFQQERQKMVQAKKNAADLANLSGSSRPKKNKGGVSGRIIFANMARTIASKWNNIDPATKQHFETLASQDKARQQKDLQEWKRVTKVEGQKQRGNKTTKNIPAKKKKRQENKAALTKTLLIRSHSNESAGGSSDGVSSSSSQQPSSVKTYPLFSSSHRPSSMLSSNSILSATQATTFAALDDNYSVWDGGQGQRRMDSSFTTTSSAFDFDQMVDHVYDAPISSKPSGPNYSLLSSSSSHHPRRMTTPEQGAHFQLQDMNEEEDMGFDEMVDQCCLPPNDYSHAIVAPRPFSGQALASEPPCQLLESSRLPETLLASTGRVVPSSSPLLIVSSTSTHHASSSYSGRLAPQLQQGSSSSSFSWTTAKNPATTTTANTTTSSLTPPHPEIFHSVGVSLGGGPSSFVRHSNQKLFRRQVLHQLAESMDGDSLDLLVETFCGAKEDKGVN
eukprot:CAMPEP_0172454508 /NCGR_PEP_ID=MMETSP1065-20121228/11475_1 /TAXON_ID=265537 /ORGANISM="Amphiprora paludosa, Strain CCMP125" /LENGTH=459 /DNA_ID=CAMNT_0013206849 /DNA_START=39 /DNA_END=1418 /DNA_ORIENTATION=+